MFTVYLLILLSAFVLAATMILHLAIDAAVGLMIRLCRTPESKVFHLID